MADMTRYANAYKIYSVGRWGNWISGDSYTYLAENNFPAIRIQTGSVRVTKISITCGFHIIVRGLYPDLQVITAKLYKDDPQNGTVIAEESFTINDSVFQSHTFLFQNLSVDSSDYIYFTLTTPWISDTEIYYQGDTTAAITYTSIPALVPSIVQPRSGSYDAGGSILFTWQSSGSGTQTKAELQCSTDGVSWQYLTTIYGSGQSYTAPAGKFTAGTVYWHIRLTSSYGIISDWVQASFTAQYNGASVTLTSPTSGTRSGADQIAFAWAITPGSGSVDGTQMQVSTDDGITWTTVLDVSYAATSYTANAEQFPQGPVKWQVRAKNSYQQDYADNWRQATFSVTYDAVSQVIPVNSPTSGNINAAVARTFSVGLQASGPVNPPFTISSALFFWRSGRTGNYTELSMTASGATASVTIPAGTFPSGVVQWYASATDNKNRTTETPVYTLSTLNAAVEAVPLSPQNTIESTSSPITFVWSYMSIDGSPQGSALLEYSRDGTTWSTLANITGNDTSYTAPAGTFPGAGILYWRVQSSNTAGTAGPMSDPISFSLFGAPAVDGVTGDGKPFLTVSWQTEGQQAYQVQVDGKNYGPYYGDSQRSYTLTDKPLTNGSHTVRVRAQNRYGLWSEWTEAAVQVTNMRGPVVWLSATDGESAALRITATTYAPTITSQPVDQYANSGTVIFGVTPDQNVALPSFAWEYRDPGQDWQPFTGTGATTNAISFTVSQALDGRQFRCRLYNEVGEVYTRVATYHYAPAQISYAIIGTWRSETGYFLVFRDGVPIGKTFSRDFIDRAAIGKHEYFVMQILPGGYYTGSYTLVPGSGISPTATATASVDCPEIAPLAGGDFIKLALSDNADRAERFQRKREVQHVQYSGARFPAAEIGEHEALSVSFDTAYLRSDKTAANAFEALVGTRVILKTPGGRVVIGVLEGYDLNDPRFYSSYRCTLTQDDWRDFINDT